MRAWEVWRHGEPRHALRAVELAAPAPAPGELRVRVSAAAMGLPDVLMCRGGYPLTPPLPFVPGQEVAGIVTAAGTAGPGALPVGTRVMGVTAFAAGRGGLAEETVMAARSAFAVPAALGDAEAAAFSIAFRTAWIGLVQRGRLQPGETLVVLGAAGGTGSAAVQLGAALGARVIAVAGGAEKGAYCAGLGASVVIDHERAEVGTAVVDATGGAGADVIYDPVGGAVANAAVAGIANEGRLLLVGYAAGEWADPPPLDVVRRNYSVVGVFAGAYDRAFNDRIIAQLGDLVAAGRIHSAVERTVGFDEVPAALDDVARRLVLGRHVLVW
jgi:NADPH2:quinone reductase